VITYEKWLETVPSALSQDALWELEVYRLALFAADLAWHDAGGLAEKKSSLHLPHEVLETVGAISASIGQGYSCGSEGERARFCEEALGAAREAQGWYYQARRFLREGVAENRIKLLARIIQDLLPVAPRQPAHGSGLERDSPEEGTTDCPRQSPGPLQETPPGRYGQVTSDVVDALRRIVGEDDVITDVDNLEPYSHDETVGLRAEPDVVVRVTSAEQIAEIFRLAQRERLPVTPRGAGYGLSGGAVPVHGGVVLSTERMNRILEIDQENLMVTVEPGLITGELHRAVEAEGFFYPPDPASLDSCTIGGNIAENAGGPRAVKYGVTRHFVCGLEVVLPSGDIITCGGKLVKNVTGYDLVQLLTGSEGTLAIVTKIILRLIPLPKAQIDLLVPYDDFQAAADTVSDIIAHRIVPTTIEFMERDSILAVEKLLQKEVPHDDAAAHLLIQLDGNRWEDVEANLSVVGELCLEHGARDVLVAKDTRNRDRLWEARRAIIDALNHASPINHMEDVVVPRAAIPALLRGIKEIGNRHAVRIINFGHAGDGNVHVNVLKDNVPDERWETLVPLVAEDIYRLALSLGGMITGEHGIGATRRRYLPLALDEAQIEIMRQIRDVFDPNRILNPGKIFP
jgi:glycolate oxidase